MVSSTSSCCSKIPPAAIDGWLPGNLSWASMASSTSSCCSRIPPVEEKEEAVLKSRMFSMPDCGTRWSGEDPTEENEEEERNVDTDI